jgi:hypothetical protein
MAKMTAAQTTAELQRKASLGIAPTSSANQTQYNAIKGVSAAAASKPASPVSTPKVSTPMSNAANSSSSPSTGYGGASYGSSGSANQAISANQSAIANQSGFRDSEINRSQGVISNLQSSLQSDPNNSDLQKRLADANKYLNVNLGYSAPAVQQMPNFSYPQSSGDAVTNVQNSSNLQQQANDQAALERAALLNSINTQRDSLKNNAQYGNQLIKDNRVLEDQALLRNSNPFSGSTGYQLAQVQRGRSIDDTSRTATLETVLGGLDQEIANFDKLTPERQRGIYQELLAAERQFGLNVGSLTGNYGGQRTLAGGAQDWNQAMDLANQTGNLPNGFSASGSNSGNNYGMNQLSQLGGTRTLQGQQMDLANKESNWNAAKDVWDATGRLVNPQADWNGLMRQVQNGKSPLTLQGQQFQSQESQRTIDNAFRTEQAAIDNAYKAGQMSLQQAQEARLAIGQDLDEAYRWAGLDFDMQKAGGAAESTFTPNQVYSAIQNKYGDFFDGSTAPAAADLESMYQDVIRYGLPEAQENDILRGIGLTDSQISAFDNKYLSTPK